MLFVRVEKRRVQTNNKAHCLLTTKNIRITKTSQANESHLVDSYFLIHLCIIQIKTFDLKQKVEISTLITLHSEGNIMCTHFSWQSTQQLLRSLKKKVNLMGVLEEKSWDHQSPNRLYVVRECLSVQHVLPIRIYCLSTMDIYQISLKSIKNVLRYFSLVESGGSTHRYCHLQIHAAYMVKSIFLPDL